MAPSFLIEYIFSHKSCLVRCPCAFQDERRGFGSSKSLVVLPRRALFLSYVHFVWQAGHLGHFEVWNVVLRDRCRTSGTFSSVWQEWHFLEVAKMLAGAGQNDRRFWTSFCLGGALFVDVACATLSALCACWIALVVAQCEF